MILPVAEGFEYEPQQIWAPSSEDILGWGTDFHALMLNDHVRMTAFKEAIQESVRPGMTVLDLGTGTGVLALWALEAGAGRVYGIDLNEAMLATAEERIGRAGYGDRFVPVQGLSYDVSLPEPVDLIISEILGNLVDNEDCVTVLNDARARFLRPGGRVLPRRAESYLAPVAAEEAHAQVSARPGRPFDLYYDVILPTSTYLATPRLLREHPLEEESEPGYRRRLTFTAHRAGRLTGFKGYFIATLSDTVALDIAGDDIAARTTSDSWKHCYLPIERPVDLLPHDRLTLDFARSGTPDPDHPFRRAYLWSGRVTRDGAPLAEFTQSTG